MTHRPHIKHIVFAVTLILAGGLLWMRWTDHGLGGPEVSKAQTDPEDLLRITSVEIPDGGTYGVLMESAGVDASTAAAIYDAAQDVYDLASIRVGRALVVTSDRADGHLLELTYQVDSEQELHVVERDGAWTAGLIPIQYDVKVRTVEGSIDTSFYASGLAQGIDEAAVVSIAEPFQWSVDFSQDIRVGDTYKIIYEERYRDGTYVMPGRILVGKFVNAGEAYYAFYHENAKGEFGHYDEDGNSVQKIFLKAPVAFKYITSGFTTGRRYVSAFNTSTGHRAIDYAAPTGTPIRAVGDGTVVQAGWNGPFGNFVSIRHNGTYTTNYAHQSRLAVKRGQHVTQGQTIGYVGSTGFSTGPHLHYEMVKNGVKINPLKELLPPGEPIAAEEKDAFSAFVAEYKQKLD